MSAQASARRDRAASRHLFTRGPVATGDLIGCDLSESAYGCTAPMSTIEQAAPTSQLDVSARLPSSRAAWPACRAPRRAQLRYEALEGSAIRNPGAPCRLPCRGGTVSVQIRQ